MAYAKIEDMSTEDLRQQFKDLGIEVNVISGRRAEVHRAIKARELSATLLTKAGSLNAQEKAALKELL